jgi:hypothetical protein
MSDPDDWSADAGDELEALVRRAQRAQAAGMSEADSQRVWERLQQQRRHKRAPRVWLAAAVAAALLVAAALTLHRPQVEIVKEVRFESVHEGKVVRFELTVYREKEKPHGEKPIR